MSKEYPVYKQLDLPAIAEEMLALWDAEDTFRKSVETREGSPDIQVLRRSPVGQRDAGHPPRDGPHHQGHLLPLHRRRKASA
jgi:hypothetical protein